MTQEEAETEVYVQEDHQVAYLFDGEGSGSRNDRPSKRRRVSKKPPQTADSPDEASRFQSLLDGAEKPEFVQLREACFQESWSKIDNRVQDTLRSSNRATLDEVNAFVEEAKEACMDQLPSAFIITGPNMAAQDLLFEQLSETLQRSKPSRFVRLRSSEVSTLKATLKKIIRDVTAQVSDDEDDNLHIGDGRDGRRYLDYDLEALHVFIESQQCEHVFVAFEDSEGFDSSLLSDLMVLFQQARLLKSACQMLYGAQFDVTQTETVLETVFKQAVAAADVPLMLGGSLLRGLLDRQYDQVAGIQTFVMSLKYTYMCHFYANPLSVLIAPSLLFETLQDRHVQAMRNTASFRAYVEKMVESSNADDLRVAKTLLESNDGLASHAQNSIKDHQRLIGDFVRALLITQTIGGSDREFSQAYVVAMEEGVAIPEGSPVIDFVRRKEMKELMAMVARIVSILTDGDDDLNLGPATNKEHVALREALAEHLENLEKLNSKAEAEGLTLRSKYSGHSKVMRTTVIAQRVQLSRDSAALKEEDKVLTDIVDKIITLLSDKVHAVSPGSVLLSEAWLYDSRTPLRDVFVPRPRAVLERSLTRPYDYLACACCRPVEDGFRSTLPETALLYRLYQETGSLINVADLWAAFSALVGEEQADERTTLVMFYRALAELRALGFVKASKKKVDHIAKLKWL